MAAPPPAAGPLEGMEDHRCQAAQPANTRHLRRRGPQMGRCHQEILEGRGLPDPPGIPAQLILEPSRPEDPGTAPAAAQPNGLTNRRMRTRLSGGVRGGGATPPPTRFPSIPQVLRLAEAVDHFKPGLGDVAMVLAFSGLRWEEAVAVLAENVDLDGQCMTIDRTASESGGRRDVREDMKTRAAVRVVMIPDIAMPAVGRLLARGAEGRQRSEGRLYSRLINGDRGGFLGYATWRKYLALAHGFTAAHKDGAVTYTAHELRHVCASLMIASGASDIQVANQMGHSRIETTKNIYGHLFAQDRAFILKAINQAVSRLYVHETTNQDAA